MVGGAGKDCGIARHQVAIDLYMAGSGKPDLSITAEQHKQDERQYRQYRHYRQGSSGVVLLGAWLVL
jgi:hypothetical protein